MTTRSSAPKDVDKLQAYLAECQSLTACSPCAEVRERLRLLGVKPETVPVEHRALSSGALATPERNHTCETCGGLGEVSIYPCARCGGSGELTAVGSRTAGALSQSLPPKSDRSTREKLSRMRDKGMIGRKS